MKTVALGLPGLIIALLSPTALAQGRPAAPPPPAAPLAAPPAPPGAPPTPGAEPPDSLDRQLSSVFQAAGGLSSDEVAMKAQATSNEVESRKAEIELAASQIDAALVAYFPKLRLGASYTRLSPIDPPVLGVLAGPVDQSNLTARPLTASDRLIAVPLSFPVLLNSYILEASLSVPLSDYLLKARQAYNAAGHSERSAQLNEQAARLKVSTDARALYYSWARARLQVVVAEQALAQAKAHLGDVAHLFDAGAASKADVLRVDSQLASSRLLVERARNLVVVLEQQLRTATHDKDLAVGGIGEDIRGPLSPLPNERSLDLLYAEATEKPPEIRALDETQWSLQDQARATRAGYLPRLDAVGDVLYANPNPRIFPPEEKFHATWSVGLQLSWTPNDWATASATVRGLDARAAQVEAQKGALRDGLRLELAQAQQAVADAEASVETSAQGLSSAEESYRVRRDLFRNGRATSVELTDAETDLTRSRLETINARIDLRIARVRLLHAVGRDAQPGGPAPPSARRPPATPLAASAVRAR